MVIVFTHFLLNLYTLFVNEKTSKSLVEKLSIAFVKASIYNFVIVYLITESLSLFNAIEFWPIATFWLFFILLNISFLLFRNEKLVFQFKKIRLSLIAFPIKIAVLAITAILLFILWQCIFFPPNNYDSMAYHMPRVMHWIQYKNVNYYPTNIIRQLYTNPFAEYVILNFQVLSSTDLWANFVQYFGLINSIIVISLIIRKLGYNYKIQFLGIVVFLANPMSIFQATTTQNDMLVTFFVLASYYFGLLFNENKTNAIVWFCVSLMLGAITKFTSLIIFIPFGMFILLKSKNQILKLSLLGISTAILFLGPFIYRNIQTFDSPIGPKKGSQMNIEVINDGFDLATTYSNIIRNSATYLTFPSKTYTTILLRITEALHNVFNLNLNNQNSTYVDSPFTAQAGYTEDNMGYILGGLLLLFCSLYSFTLKKSQKKTAFLGILIFMSLVTFSTILKYQPMHPRLLLPLSALAAIYIAIISSNLKAYIQYAIIALFLISTIPLLFFNKSKPVVVLENLYRKLNGIPHSQLSKSDYESVTSKSKLAILDKYYDADLNLKPDLSKKDLSFLSHFLIDSLNLKERKSALQNTRIDNYFNNKPSYKDDYKSIVKIIKNKRFRNIGLSLNFDGMEYPAWVLLAENDYSFKIYNLIWYPELLITPNYKANSVDCIIVDTSDIDNVLHENLIEEKYIYNEISLVILKKPYKVQ